MIDRAGGRPAGRPPHGGGLTINFDRAVRTQIEERAAGEGVRPWELVGRWVIERLRDDTMGDERDEMWSEIDALRAEVSRLGQKLELLSHGATAKRERQGRTTPPLHVVIARVLAEAAQPLSIEEISRRIRDDRLFSGPRSGKPPSTSMISSRIAHQAYRSAFRREGRLVSLAMPLERIVAGRALDEKS